VHKVIWIIWYQYKHFHSFVQVAQRDLKYCIHNKIPFGWQPHQVACRPTQCLSSILIWLTTKTAKTIFKARAYRWVHADGVIALCQMIAVLSLFSHWTSFMGCQGWMKCEASSLLKLLGCKWIYAVSFTVQYMQIVVLPSLHVLLNFCLVTMKWWLCYINVAHVFLACGCYWLSCLS